MKTTTPVFGQVALKSLSCVAWVLVLSFFNFTAELIADDESAKTLLNSWKSEREKFKTIDLKIRELAIQVRPNDTRNAASFSELSKLMDEAVTQHQQSSQSQIKEALTGLLERFPGLVTAWRDVAFASDGVNISEAVSFTEAGGKDVYWRTVRTEDGELTLNSRGSQNGPGAVVAEKSSQLKLSNMYLFTSRPVWIIEKLLKNNIESSDSKNVIAYSHANSVLSVSKQENRAFHVRYASRSKHVEEYWYIGSQRDCEIAIPQTLIQLMSTDGSQLSRGSIKFIESAIVNNPLPKDVFSIEVPKGTVVASAEGNSDIASANVDLETFASSLDEAGKRDKSPKVLYWLAILVPLSVVSFLFLFMRKKR